MVTIDSEEFNSMVLTYANIHDKKSMIRKEVLNLTKHQKTLSDQIEKVMMDNDVERIDVGDGVVSLYNSKRTSPVNKDTIAGALDTHPFFEKVPNRSDVIESIVEHIYSSRKVTLTPSLKRTTTRKKT